ncbi:MAG: hypothetical protein ACLVJB_07725, partial [Christensenellales bacterium]
MTETAQVLCIVNTRKRARQVYESLPEEGRFHLSTLMIPTDREKTLDVIRERLQNGEDLPRGFNQFGGSGRGR